MTIASNTLIGRRYILNQPLGAGGMGMVYRAHDRLTGTTVALKRVLEGESARSDSSPEAEDQRLALAQEFRVLSSLRHPNIISVLDYGFDDDKQPYYTMELLEGAQSILEAGVGQGMQQCLGLVAQVLQALSYLHRRGVVHRDLKPRNVLVSQGLVKVLDFGLSLMQGQVDVNKGSTTAGTLAYMAPEVLMGQPADESADLYAVGMMIFEMLAGRHPFDSEDITTLLNHILYSVPDVDGLDVEPGLKVVLERLLARDRQVRFRDASEALRDLGAIASLAIPLETAATRESFMQAARLVEREAEVAQLSAALAEAEAARGSLWLVSGESGVGKSRLLDEVRSLALVRGVLVLRGQGVTEGGSPYFLWRSALRWLVMQTGLPDETLSTLKTLVPDMEELLGRAIPDAANLPPAAAQRRLLDAIQTVLAHLNQPTVLILEDIQWATESLDVLAHIADQLHHLPLLIVGSFRDDERPDLAASIPSARLLRLRRLSASGIAQLSEAMLGENGRQPEVVELLQRETEGNVFFLVEVVRLLAEEAGQLDRIGLVTLPASVFAGGMQRVIERRLSRVPVGALPLLSAAAVMGRWLDLTVLRQLESGTDLDQWLNVCADAAVLEVFEDRWRFAHDKLREGVLSIIAPEPRRLLHGRIAAALEVVSAQDAEVWPLLAFHYGHAGERSKEAHFGALAGAQALRHGAYRDAISYFERALQLALANGSTGDQVSFKSQIAAARLGLGEYRTARQLYQENLVAASDLGDDAAVASSLMSLGDVALVRGEAVEARQFFEEALRLFERLGDARGQASVFNRLGDVAYELGEEAAALAYFQRSMILSRQNESGWGMGGSIRQTTEVRSALQSPSAGVIRDMAQAALGSGDERQIFPCLWAAVRYLLSERRAGEALRLLSVLIHQPGVGEALATKAEQLSLELEPELLAATRATQWEAGRSATPTEALNWVLSLL